MIRSKTILGLDNKLKPTKITRKYDRLCIFGCQTAWNSAQSFIQVTSNSINDLELRDGRFTLDFSKGSIPKEISVRNSAVCFICRPNQKSILKRRLTKGINDVGIITTDDDEIWHLHSRYAITIRSKIAKLFTNMDK